MMRMHVSFIFLGIALVLLAMILRMEQQFIKKGHLVSLGRWLSSKAVHNIVSGKSPEQEHRNLIVLMLQIISFVILAVAVVLLVEGFMLPD